MTFDVRSWAAQAAGIASLGLEIVDEEWVGETYRVRFGSGDEIKAVVFLNRLRTLQADMWVLTLERRDRSTEQIELDATTDLAW